MPPIGKNREESLLICSACIKIVATPSKAYELITKYVANKDAEIERDQIQLNDTSGQLDNEHSELETTLKNMVEMETRLNEKRFISRIVRKTPRRNWKSPNFLPTQNDTEVAKLLDKWNWWALMHFTLHFKPSSKVGVTREGKLNIGW
jgi:hypothetical protein